MDHSAPPKVGTSFVDDLSRWLAATATELFSVGSLEQTFQRVVDTTVETIDGCDCAGIFVKEGSTVVTSVHSAPLVVEIDALQHRTGEGPCFDAIAIGGSFYASELGEDARWPRFGPMADAAGIRSALALQLGGGGIDGALNLYAHYPDAFGVVDRANGLLLAQVATVALGSARTHDASFQRTANLEAALVTRELIGKAEGILMERERITSEQAFDVLRRASQRLNVKLRDVAQNLVDTGESPDPGTSSGR